MGGCGFWADLSPQAVILLGLNPLRENKQKKTIYTLELYDSNKLFNMPHN